jgi:hypothetical protein
MKCFVSGSLYAVVIGLGLILSPPLPAEDSSLPAEPQAKSPATESVQPQVEEKSADEAADRRRQIIAEARVALDETRRALQALEEENVAEALAALEKATGKLELILARDPALALAPVGVDVVTHDLLASPDTVKAMIHDAENYLEDGEVQQARRLMAGLASEIVLRTTSIPLVTYPDAIKAVIPLIDAGRLDEARAGLQAALGTLVTTDEIIPLPILRAELLLESAEVLAEQKERTAADNEDLEVLLGEARTQLKMAALLGYGARGSFDPLYEQLDQIEEKSAGGKSGTGWFDRIRQQISERF